ncbi:MAG: DUF4974 domain-containing protein [Bacteroidales bacterium]|nr:DUF4974 domain-containing protein [Bacteroidales bacterium]
MEHTEERIVKVLEKLIASSHAPQGRYSAKATYPLLRKKIFGRRLMFVRRSLAAAATIAILCAMAWWGYQSFYTTQTVSVYAQANIRNISLPDGTRITLNRYSSITYPKKFKERREVSLNGEAYFEVEHDSRHPFVVKTSTIKVEDLGTRFNISAYQQSPTITTALIEGSVNVIDDIHRKNILLKPGETALYNKKSRQLSQQATNRISDDIAWRNGSLVFEHCSISEVAERLSNSFNVTIKITDKTLSNYHINAKFCHKEGLRTILDILQQAGYFNYQLTNNQILLYKRTNSK